jgi:hypothetical protein
MPSIYQQVSRDIQQILTEFSSDFDSAFALADVDQWSYKLGMGRNSDALRTVWPIPLTAAGYKLREGDDKLRRLFERSLSMTTKSWYDGVYESAKVVEKAGDWIGWDAEPANIAQEAVRHPNVLVADMLATNPYLDFYRVEKPGGTSASTKRLFAADHPYHVLKASVGTFDNDWSAGDSIFGEAVGTAIDSKLISLLRRYFRAIKGPNGRPLGLRFGALLVPAAQEEACADAFERDTILQVVQNAAANVGGVTLKNRFYGTQYTVADELTGELPSGASGDDDVIYAIGTRVGVPAPAPWVVQRSETPEVIEYDRTSDFYRDTGNIGVKFVLDGACAAALPHAIVRINLSP